MLLKYRQLTFWRFLRNYSGVTGVINALCEKRSGVPLPRRCVSNNLTSEDTSIVFTPVNFGAWGAAPRRRSPHLFMQILLNASIFVRVEHELGRGSKEPGGDC